ncbi:MAG: A/G-specific adenine glycosylase [Rhodothermales bacterium]
MTLPPLTDAHRLAFQHTLLDWFEGARRAMPWRETRDPYRIWISEIMLQQTRVDQATPYYLRFVEAFPTVEALAAAPLDDVLKNWEGLGYYSRARNLHKAAKHVVERGAFPNTHTDLLAMPGVGPYTAAAVASIAFGLPHAVLDGNVIRVLTRAFAIGADSKSSKTRKALQQLADALIPHEQPAAFNEGIMELGATICTPKNPSCLQCPLKSCCAALAEGTPTAYPVSKKKAPIPHKDIAVGLIFDHEERVFIQRRPEDAMLGGLWEFPGGKREPGEALADTCRREIQEELGVDVEIVAPFMAVDHAYSHFKITMHAFQCRITSGVPMPPPGTPWAWVTLDELDAYAFPKANRRLIDALQRRAQNPTLFDGV